MSKNWLVELIVKVFAITVVIYALLAIIKPYMVVIVIAVLLAVGITVGRSVFKHFISPMKRRY